MTKYQKVMLDVKDIMQLTGIGRDRAYGLMHSQEFPIKIIGKKRLVHEEVFHNWHKGETKSKKK